MAEAWLLALALVAALAAPHVLRLERASPGRAAAAWMAALTLRATLAGAAAVLVLATVPSTPVFDALTTATWHEPLPGISLHLDIPGDAVAHLGVLLPAGLLLASVTVFALTVLLAGTRLNHQLERRSLGHGPRGSLVLADERVLVAVPAFGRKRILVSHAALAAFDGSELEATLAHEAGHLRRGHRGARLLAGGLASVGRVLPGARAAERGLRLSLERDADEYAVRATGDPLALASAICKAAGPRSGRAGLLALEGGDAALRLEPLLDHGRRARSVALDRAALAIALALALAATAVVVGVALVVGPRPSGLVLALACGA